MRRLKVFDPIHRETVLISMSIIVICSCSGLTSHERHQQTYLDKVRIEFDTSSTLQFNFDRRPDFDFSQLISPDSVAFANSLMNSIDIYSLRSGELITRHSYPIDGPNRIGRLSNFLISDDTIYCVDAFKYEVVSFDLNGNAIQRFRTKSAQFEHSILPRQFTTSQIHKDGEWLYILGDPDINPHSPDLQDGQYIVSINLKTKKISQLASTPKFLTDNKWMVNQYFYRHIYHNSKWLFSFEISDSIIAYDKLGLKTQHFAGSKYATPFKKWGKRDLNSEAAYKYYLSASTYGQLTYDPKNQLYYRFGWHPNISAIARQNLDQMWVKKMSIIILDKDLNRIGEHFINDKRIGGAFLSTEHGTYISFNKEDTLMNNHKMYVLMKPILGK